MHYGQAGPYIFLIKSNATYKRIPAAVRPAGTTGKGLRNAGPF